jgi:hypothetical protein
MITLNSIIFVFVSKTSGSANYYATAKPRIVLAELIRKFDL